MGHRDFKPVEININTSRISEANIVCEAGSSLL